MIKSITLLLTLLTCFVLAQSNADAQTISAPYIGDSFENVPCRGKDQGYGPYDYTLRHNYKEQLYLVESAHFKPQVQQLIRGVTNTSPLADLDYTLRAFPNHHPALYTAIRVRLFPETLNFGDIRTFTPAECWLQRAIYFSPNDSMSHMLYALLLHRTGETEKAIDYYEKSLEHNQQNAQAMYNYGLLLTELKRYDEAVAFAKKLYDRKFPLTGLKQKLISAGQW